MWRLSGFEPETVESGPGKLRKYRRHTCTFHSSDWFVDCLAAETVVVLGKEECCWPLLQRWCLKFAMIVFEVGTTPTSRHRICTFLSVVVDSLCYSTKSAEIPRNHRRFRPRLHTCTSPLESIVAGYLSRGWVVDREMRLHTCTAPGRLSLFGLTTVGYSRFVAIECCLWCGHIFHVLAYVFLMRTYQKILLRIYRNDAVFLPYGLCRGSSDESLG